MQFWHNFCLSFLIVTRVGVFIYNLIITSVLQFNNKFKKCGVFSFVFSGTLMLQLDGCPTGDGVKVKVHLRITAHSDKS